MIESMTIAEMDAEIARLKADDEAKRTAMAALKERFKEEMKQFARTWYEGQAREAVASQHQKAQALGEEGMRQLKQDLRVVAEASPAKVEEVMDQPDLWPHLKPTSEHDYSYVRDRYEQNYASRMPSELNSAIRDVLGLLGPVLSKYGLAAVNNWRKTNHFAGNLSWPPKLMAVIQEYGKLHGQLALNARRLFELKEQRATSAARDLFDRA